MAHSLVSKLRDRYNLCVPLRNGQTDKRLPGFQPIFFPHVALGQLEIISVVQGMHEDRSIGKSGGNLLFSSTASVHFWAPHRMLRTVDSTIASLWIDFCLLVSTSNSEHRISVPSPSFVDTYAFKLPSSSPVINRGIFSRWMQGQEALCAHVIALTRTNRSPSTSGMSSRLPISQTTTNDDQRRMQDGCGIEGARKAWETHRGWQSKVSTD